MKQHPLKRLVERAFPAQKQGSIDPSVQQQLDRESSVALILKVPEEINISPLNGWDNENKENLQTQDESLVHLLLMLKRQLAVFEHAEVLFLQRTFSDKDVYSGDVCFPGGKLESNETALEAAVRETLEETGLHLHQHNLLGQINQKFKTSSKRMRKSLTSVFIFQVSALQSESLSLNKEQIGDYRWVPVDHFLNSEVYTYHQAKEVYLQWMLQAANVEKEEQIECLLWPSIDIGLSTNLYGLTYYIMAFVCAALIKQVESTMNLLKQAMEGSSFSSSSKQDIVQMVETLQVFDLYCHRIKDHYYDDVNIKIKNQQVDQQLRERIQWYNQFVNKLAHGLRPKL